MEVVKLGALYDIAEEQCGVRFRQVLFGGQGVREGHSHNAGPVQLGIGVTRLGDKRAVVSINDRLHGLCVDMRSGTRHATIRHDT